jgi:hypothetical protein
VTIEFLQHFAPIAQSMTQAMLGPTVRKRRSSGNPNCIGLSERDTGRRAQRTMRATLICLTLICCLLLPISVMGQQAEETLETTDESSVAVTPADSLAEPLSDSNSPPDPQGNVNVASAGSSGSSSSSASSGSSTTAPAAGSYVFPSTRRMARYWVWSIIGPRTLIPAAFRASWNTWVTDSPEEWEKNASGWGKRFGVSTADNAMNQTALVLLSGLMHQDPMYYRCPCSGTWPRARHALKMTFMGRNRSGDYVLSPPKVVSRWVGPLVTRNTLYPSRFNSGDAAVSGATYLAGSAVWNLVREFFLKSPKW